MASDYEVGYGKPPKNRQFEPGKSGNSKGRPRGSMNVATMFTRISHEMIHVTENGKTKMMSRLEAVLLQMANRALSGDARTMKEFVQWSRLFEEAENTEPGVAAPAERDTAVMASILNRMRRVGADSEDDQPAKSEKDSETIEDLQDEYEEDEV